MCSSPPPLISSLLINTNIYTVPDPGEGRGGRVSEGSWSRRKDRDKGLTLGHEKKYSNCVKVEVYKAHHRKQKGNKKRARFYGVACFHLALGPFRVSKVLLVTCSLLWTERTPLSWAKQITASILPCYCYRSNPLNKWLNNLLAGWLTDTQLPRGSQLCFVCSGPAHHSTSTTLAFSPHRSLPFFPSVP